MARRVRRHQPATAPRLHGVEQEAQSGLLLSGQRVRVGHAPHTAIPAAITIGLMCHHRRVWLHRPTTDPAAHILGHNFAAQAHAAGKRRAARFPRPAPHLGGREKFRVDQQAPPLRARLRNQTRPPRSHGPPRHDHDHDQATRPNLTVFKHPLRDGQPVRTGSGQPSPRRYVAPSSGWNPVCRNAGA